MATPLIRIAGVDYTAHVVLRNAVFESAVNGAVGTAKFRLRDDERTISLVTGAIIELLIDGAPVWTGYLQSVSRVYAFPAENVTDAGLTRWLDIEAADINILLKKRIVFNPAAPANQYIPPAAPYPAYTADNVVIADLVANYLDLTGDSLDVTTYVENVADINADQEARPASASYTWADAMDSIAMLPGAVYFLHPARNLVYTDVNTASAPYVLSDAPAAGQAGYREMTLTLDGTSLANDVLAWGTGMGSQNRVFDRVTDAASLALHGRWQAGKLDSGVYKQATINRVATSVVDGSPSNQRGARDDRTAITLVTYEPGFLPAQKVDFRSTVFGFSDIVPIRRLRVTFDAPSTPRYELTISHAIDSPWGFFDQYLLTLPGFGFPGFTIPGFWFPSCVLDNYNNRVDAVAWGVPSGSGSWRWSDFVSMALLTGSQACSVDGSVGIDDLATTLPGRPTTVGGSFSSLHQLGGAGTLDYLDYRNTTLSLDITSYLWDTFVDSVGGVGLTDRFLVELTFGGRRVDASFPGGHQVSSTLLLDYQLSGSAVAVGALFTPADSDITLPDPVLLLALAPPVSNVTLTIARQTNPDGTGSVTYSISPIGYSASYPFTDPANAISPVTDVFVIIGNSYQQFANASNTDALDRVRSSHLHVDNLEACPSPVPILSGAQCLIGLTVSEYPAALSSTLYQTSCAYQPGSLVVRRNGLRQVAGTDFATTGPPLGEFTFSGAVLATDLIYVEYTSGGPR